MVHSLLIFIVMSRVWLLKLMGQFIMNKKNTMRDDSFGWNNMGFESFDTRMIKFCLKGMV